MSTAASEPRRLRADAARNRQALIDAAERLFATRGLSVTLDDIATEAGVNVATAYRHFSNKYELADPFLERKIDEAVAIAERAASAEDPWQGLTGFLTGTLELMAASRGLHDIFSLGYAAPWLDRLTEHLEPVIESLMVRAQAAAQLRADLQTGDLGVILQMLTSVTEIPAEDEARLVQRYLTLILAGLRPAEPPLPGEPPSPQQTREGLRPPRDVHRPGAMRERG